MKTAAKVVAQKEEPNSKKPKKRAGKALLSFGGDEEEASEPLLKKPKFNTDLVIAAPSNGVSHQPEKQPARPAPSPEKKLARPAPPPQRERRKSSPPPAISPKLNQHPEAQLPLPNEEEPSSSDDSSSEDFNASERKSALERTKEQIAALKASMRRDAAPKTEQRVEKKSALERMIPANALRGRRRKKGKDNHEDDAQALKTLDAFRARLEQAAPARKKTDTSKDNAAKGNKPASGIEANADDEEAQLCDLHFIVNCQSCQNWDGHAQEDEENDSGTDWMAHALSFEKDRLGKDLTWKKKNEEELVVIDPREKAQDIKAEQRAKRQAKRSGRAWDKDRDRGRVPERMAGARG